MWPYTGKKTFTSKLGVFGSGPKCSNTGNVTLDNEYYKKCVSPAQGKYSFTLNQIADDGRVYKCYGLDKREITEEFGYETRGRMRKVQVNMTKPYKQLHEKNVNRLKVVLSMPATERKISLTHVTDAILRNEIIPSDMRLQNESSFLSDYARTTTPRLPPLRRKSFILARDIQQSLKKNPIRRGSKTHKPPIMYHDNAEEEGEEGDMILPAITVDNSRAIMEELTKASTVDGEAKTVRHRVAMPARRRGSVAAMIRASAKGNDEEKTSNPPPQVYYNKPISRQLERKDSVGKTTESISEQFRAVIQSAAADPGLNIAGKHSHAALAKQLADEPDKTKKVNGYKLRHEYGKNLERNWFKKHVLKQGKPKPKPIDANQDCELRLDIFYSPEPESDSEMGEGEDIFLEDESMQCGGFSTATAEARGKKQNRKPSRRISQLPAEAIWEEDEEPIDSDRESSESDIEIVLKDNQLIQRKTKHKMRKKRVRQMQRYKTFMDAAPPAVPEAVAEKEMEVPLTDQEIRALRLNLRNKERLKKLKGKRKFLQVANAVYIVAQFKKILTNIRKRKRNIIKKRQQRIAAMVAKRANQKEAKNDDLSEDEEEREPSPKPSLKEQFMREIGNKLVYDLEKIRLESDSDTEEDEEEEDDDSESEPVSEKPKRKSKPECHDRRSVSKFAAEIKKVSLGDAGSSRRGTMVSNRMFRRRNTLPHIGRPYELVVEVPVKPKRKGKGKKDNKNNKRAPSPEIKCSCYFHNKLLARQSQASLARQPIKCQHQAEVKKPKMKKVKIETSGLYRTYSLENLAKRRPIELRDLLKDIDIPAKEIKLQILARKFRRERRRRQRVKLSPCRQPDYSPDNARKESDSGSEEAESDESDKSDYDFVYGAPFVGCGVMWHQDSRARREPSWTEEDVEREVKKITRVFHELKECRYLRLDSFNTAIMTKLNDKKKHM